MTLLNSSNPNASVSHQKPKGLVRQSWFPPVTIILAIFYHEILIYLFDNKVASSPFTLVYGFLGALITGLILHIIFSLIPFKKLGRFLLGVLYFLFTVYVCVMHICKFFFLSYFDLTFMTDVADDAIGSFTDLIFSLIFQNIGFILLSLLPFVYYCLLRKYIVPKKSNIRRSGIKMIVVALVAQLLITGLAYTGHYRDAYSYDYSEDHAVPHFGLVTSLRLELQYGMFGIPKESIRLNFSGEDVPEEPTIEYNKLDIDFDALLASETDATIQSMHSYFKSVAPTAKNDYTGMFQGKNLITIVAESYSPYFISEEYTPALYKLTHNGFIFTDYYQPLWGQSTSGGEYSTLCGNIPITMKVNGESVYAMFASKDNYKPFTIGNELSALGYHSYGWHNNVDNYYDRDQTHNSLGFEFHGTTTGLQNIGDRTKDPNMFKATMPDVIDEYLTTGVPFNLYYLTISAHAPYEWGKHVSDDNRAVAEEMYPDSPSMIQAYAAASMELEYAMEYLLDALETAGILDDTVICLTADHYPYILGRSPSNENYNYYNMMNGYDDTESDISRYLNSFVLYNSAMETPVVIDTPCSSIDILPTICNLFGVTYDSRLLSGHDMLSPYTPGVAGTNMPVAVISTLSGHSWKTDLGYYDSGSRKFIANEGVTVPEGYVDTVNDIVSAKYSFARLLISEDYYRILFGNDMYALYNITPIEWPAPSTDTDLEPAS